ncbi:Shedu anti-phage system protein SduA domain-containing protein [Xanthocytophaga agilis]|uniref:DUF4263 domain-containing protein n=1 Tax=Xanthocytophaga agilis TaxID=3048010 RepID=A0AAE3R1G4_9BACT|nr:Shedu anti-phage system protein SduA domain-containing protein [Xanthocytophaga agilis]MDJ1502046.1 DUF4263 domain-containing protein [Xanthocytophaga agilis]
MRQELSIEQLVDLAEREGSLEEISQVVAELYKHNDTKALDLCIKLALSDYGGITYKAEFQNIGVIGTLHWGPNGIKKLAEAAINAERYRATNNVTRFLSYISSKSLEHLPFIMQGLPSIQLLELSSEKYKTSAWTKAAKESLIDVVKSVETEDRFPMGITNNLGFAINENAQEHIFAALIARWFNFSSNGLKHFSELVFSRGKAEIDYQNFLVANPYILEPFHAQIWSKPKFGEDLIPDFLIRSMDNSYTVVEIEQADFPIMTKAGELSAKTTHAKRQALDFRDWAINNGLYAAKKFPGIYRPYCLVVIGCETELDAMQAQRLKQENESTQGVLKIVGFDWLLNRAAMTLDNLVNFGFDRHTFKETIKE